MLYIYVYNYIYTHKNAATGSSAPDDFHGDPPGVPSLPLWFPVTRPGWNCAPWMVCISTSI